MKTNLLPPSIIGDFSIQGRVTKVTFLSHNDKVFIKSFKRSLKMINLPQYVKKHRIFFIKGEKIHMRKILLTLFASLSLIVLGACGDDKVESEKTESDSTQEESSESIMDIYEKAIAAAEEIESAEVTVELDQVMEFDGEEMETSSEFTMLMTMEPFVMHQVGTTSMAFGPDNEETMDIEMYMTDEDMYFYEGFSGQWISMGEEMGDLLGTMSDLDDQQDPYEQLKMFEDYIEHFSVETTDDAYVLSLTADPESLDEFFSEILEETMSGELDMLLEDDLDIFESMDIEALSYKITLDKDSLQVKAYDMQMDMTITEDGESMRISQDVRSVYSNINEVGPIEVPQEVIDNAVDAF